MENLQEAVDCVCKAECEKAVHGAVLSLIHDDCDSEKEVVLKTLQEKLDKIHSAVETVGGCCKEYKPPQKEPPPEASDREKQQPWATKEQKKQTKDAQGMNVLGKPVSKEQTDVGKTS